VTVNSTAIPLGLSESSLFGHRKGAFTGATQETRGLLARANAGTLFLDEIGDMAIELQPKLLRAIELRAFPAVGAEWDQFSDFRVVAATHGDLMALVERGRFRSDLAYRLMGCVLDVPPLRKRAEDIPLLATHFLQANAEVSGDPAALTQRALGLLQEQPWPGNVRQLRTVVLRAAMMSDGPVIHAATVAEVLGGREDNETGSSGRVGSMLALARNELLLLLEEADWDTEAAAKRCGVARGTIYRRMMRLNIVPQARTGALRSRAGFDSSLTRNAQDGDSRRERSAG
jgi:DNA-binding NtrC family response regulator